MDDLKFENSDIAKKLANYKLPRFCELTNYNLFMTQLINVLEEYLSVFSVPNEEKNLTPSMINNYVFKQVLEPPTRRKYSKIHLAHLIVIGILKQVLSLSDIKELIEAQMKQYPIEIAYDYFCTEVENALCITFFGRNFGEIEKNVPTKVTPLTQKVRSAVLSFANKIYVKQSIYFDKQ